MTFGTGSPPTSPRSGTPTSVETTSKSSGLRTVSGAWPARDSRAGGFRRGHVMTSLSASMSDEPVGSLMQRRGFTDSECVTRFSGPIRTFSDPFCYDRLARCSEDECILGDGEDRRPFGILANRSRYSFQSFGLPSVGYEAGYFQFFPATDEAAGRAQVAQLKHDRWMDSESQWARLDFPLLVADQALLIDFRLILDVDPTGRITPLVLLDMFRLTWYDFSRSEDAVRLVLELLTLALWALQIYDAARDFMRCRARFSNLSRVEMWNRCPASSTFHDRYRLPIGHPGF